MALPLPICDQCTEAMATGEHLPTMHCCTCDLNFDDTEIYNLHILLLHLWKSRGRENIPSAAFACADCQIDYYDEKGFNNHLKEHEMTQNAVQQQNITETKTRRRRGRKPNPDACSVPKPPKQKKKSKKKNNNDTPNVTAPNATPANPIKEPKKKKKKKNKICPDCNRDFVSKKARKNHLCPNRYPCISENCLRTFRKLTGLTDHLESGACKGGHTREKISRIICERDKKGLVTVPGAQMLLEGHYGRVPEVLDDDAASDLGNAMENLSLSSWGVLTPISNGSGESFEMVANEGVPLDLDNLDIISLASGDTFSDATPESLGSSILISEPINPKQCQICFKIFNRVEDLKQHKESAAHVPKIYHCKLSVLGLTPTEPVKQFNTLSGLVAHIENGSCRGGMAAFDIAISMMGQLAKEFGFTSTADTQQKLIAVAASKRAAKAQTSPCRQNPQIAAQMV
ncbi:hypothetical protein AOL_s00080g382 [Orbilia oligospora ATCC 24927]|uniref:C2H2-type domain-containing protein n=1 Tax=Arthrobotrys oligospora (strain ATCC 24927 / CBS 115.81 / DSM 1491) TaxID=756982 RepID=G1XEZ7_ARTOA|nr:hypothetical protein AOL_s00080g382 [Orbilia oligospora ATCC 24927]EGX48257.1 hypothetical protein AOL_s00080g382 [Orbilia oligospora ATCC 24927]